MVGRLATIFVKYVGDGGRRGYYITDFQLMQSLACEVVKYRKHSEMRTAVSRQLSLQETGTPQNTVHSSVMID